jgi:hypothetical protein
MDRLRHAWNVFFSEEQTRDDRVTSVDLGPAYSWRADRPRYLYTNERTIVSSVYTRLAIDTAAVPVLHVRLDENGQYQEEIDSGLNNCLTIEANLDQGATMFRQDLIQSLFDQGVVAALPVDTTLNPLLTGGWDISTMRVGRIVQWYPRHVTVRAYNQKKGIPEDVTVPKEMVAIVENPLYSVMNEPNSTLQRLLRKLSLLDIVDEQSASGKLDIIIQLPYVIKTETRRAEANKRLREIELQLKGSQYGIAYTDGSERITQLNRPAENNLMGQVEYLTKMLYSQLGLTEEVMNGTADEAAMINYYNRSVEPVLTAITEAMTRTFLTKTARTQGQAVIYLRDPFKLVPVSVLAEIADKLTRNEILSSNEVRSIIGFKPSSDPNASKLQNKNIPPPAPAQKSIGRVPSQQLPLMPHVPSIPRGANSQNGT